ncbi:SusC/RagA family TonB-linked outer membrane protein [Niastella koreensis]|uniref:TonB-dependent receptor plug n=2 Tax=Niastella koreensis TaxID=354356 RepID=G8T6Z0_NIAKG|nr:TonB-dependent receptor [Niastella koreensis]AEV99011.1 TonB-dependent receptor plug [Niastella koreensis GR20-10]OQP43929.1 SusC/RagA family TonB-linked outer membrane protein [Niastella koreensis]
MKHQRLVTIFSIAMRVGFIQVLLIVYLGSYAYYNNADAQGVLDKIVSVSVEKGQLKEVFNLLQNQTGARIVYSSKTIEAGRKVSIKASQKKLGEVLAELLSPFGITFKLIRDRIILFKAAPNSFNDTSGTNELAVQLSAVTLQDIKGQVTDDKGNPLPGVSIVVKGTGTGTNTDMNGNFTIAVPEGKTILVVSSVGFQTQEINIAGKTSLAIVMTVGATGQLSDIVVVGYGTQKKVTVTGAVAQVKGAELAKSPSVNLSNALAGRLPGVTAIQSSGEPGYDGSTIRIRGSNTPNNSGALIVIDGVPDRAGGLERLNPQDIESMSVLKDAAAAIYGSRAANGVILITTKRGKNGKPQLSYAFNQGWAQPTRIPKMSDAVEYATIINELTLFDGLPADQWAAGWNAFKQNGTYTRTDNGVKVDAIYSPADITKFGDGTDPWGHPNTDWYHTTLKTWSPQSNHNVQMSGGSDNVKYLASLGYENQDGYYKNSATGYKQYDMRLNVDAKVNKYLSTSLGLTAREEYRFFPTVGAQPIFRMLMRGKPTEQEVWPNGLPGPDIENGQNPIVITTNQTGYDKDHRDYFQTNGRIDLQVPFVEGLKISGFAALDKYFRREKRWETPWYLYFWDKVSYEADGVTPKLTKSVRSTFNDPRLTESQEDQLNINLSGFISYDKTFGPHTMNIMAAVTRETIGNQTFNAFRRNYISPAIDQLFAGGDAQKDNTGSAYDRARLSYFGRVNYNYKEKYLAEFLWRYDGSYMFPENDRFGFFPGILLGWRLSEEKFFKRVTFINNLKLRASWGQMGNDNILFNGVLQEYRYLSTYGFNSYIVGGNVVKTLTETGVPNPGYTWEVANNSNVGLEGSALNSRLSFEFDVFNNIRTKILMQNSAVVPASAGITLPPENLGKVQNRGFEFTIGYNDNFGDFRFGVSVNGGYAKNKVINLPETPGLKPYQYSKGHTFGTDGAAFLVYEYDGVFVDQDDINKNKVDYSAATNKLLPGDMKIKDVSGDGKIDADDRVRLEKNRDPWFTGGVNFNLQYKDFDCSILFQGATGGLLFFGTESGTIGNFLKYSYDHRWTVEHPSSTDPRLANRGNTYFNGGSFGTNTYWLRSSNYLRLKNVEFGYNLPGKIGQKAGVSNLRLYVNGINLVTLDKMKIYDPESTSGNGQYYPQSRILNVGARISF